MDFDCFNNNKIVYFKEAMKTPYYVLNWSIFVKY